MSINYLIEIRAQPIQYFSLYPIKEYTEEGLLKNRPSGISWKIDKKEGKSTISSVNFEILNKNLIASKYIYSRNDSLYKKEVFIFSIENNIKTLLYVGRIRSIKPSDYESTSFIFEIADIQDDMKENIFTNKIAKQIFYRGDITIDKPEASQLLNKTYIKYLSYSENDSSITFEKLYYEVSQNPEDENYSEKIKALNFEYTDYCKFTGNPITLAKNICILMAGEQYVDESSFSAIEYEVPNMEFYFEAKLSDPLKFLQDKIFKICNCYSIVTQEGKIALKEYRQPTIDDTNGIVEISENNIISITPPNVNYEDIVNQCIVRDNYNWESKDWDTDYYYLYNESYAKYNRLLPKKPLEIEFPVILGTELEKIAWRDRVKSRLFTRYGFENPSIKVKLLYHMRDKISVGKFVNLTHKTMINWKGARAGERGIYNGLENSNLIGIATWGDYLESLELGKIDGVEIIEVRRVVTINFFNSIILNQNEIVSYLAYNNRGGVDIV